MDRTRNGRRNLKWLASLHRLDYSAWMRRSNRANEREMRQVWESRRKHGGACHCQTCDPIPF